MDRLELIDALENYITPFHEENAFIPRFKSLLINFDNCYSRSLITGHMTASAWIIDKRATAALLVHHKKLNKWLQPGGHADGEEDILAVAKKEAEEETGLKTLQLYHNLLFDIDIHLIPTHMHVKAHLHHDIRFLFIADREEEYIVSEESNELAWIPLDKLNEFTANNHSINRMLLKTNSVFN